MKRFILLINIARANKNIILKIIIAILALSGAISIFYLTNLFGTGITPDSVAYISVARHISAGLGFINFDGYVFILQPPLYPIILGIIKKILFIDPLISAGYLNSVLFGLIIFYSGLYLTRLLRSFALTILGVFVVLISSTLITISLTTFTEPLFILFIILFLYYLDKYIKRGMISSLVLFSLAITFACLTRYVGVVLILTGSICILVFGEKPGKEKLKNLILFLLITLLPTGIWVLRNYLLSGTLVGQRAGSSFTLIDNLMLFFNTIIKWYLPWQINKYQLLPLLIVVLIGIIDRYVLMYKLKNVIEGFKQFGPIIIFILLYSFFIIVSSTTTAFDKIDNRLLSPIYIPLIFVIFLLLDNILNYFKQRFHLKILTICFLFIIIVWTRYPINRTNYYVNNYIENSGWEYGSKIWKDNTVINYLNNSTRFNTGYSIFSNAPEAVYILANLETRWSPHKTMYNSPGLLIPKNIWYKEKKAILVWFNNLDRNFLFNIDELKEQTVMVKIAELKDGDIYTISKK